ncbi:hypothetical protein niasHT_001510 [Heterodera trifolii]|uniref:Uncharacterized protein n=1 Tax=Heterodera trifolii TaxID=157864 RepID=A0ABD2M465_9BILA
MKRNTAWTCAWKPFVYLRLLGAIVPPCAVLWISIERFFSIFASSIYRNRISPNKNIPPICILVYTAVAVLIAYTLSWYNRCVHVEAYCGRKNAFTRNYTTFVYLADFFGFFIALVINCVSLCHLGRLYTQREHRIEAKKQLKRIHYLLVISLVSTLTVAIPNGISLTSAWFGRLNIALSDPANWMIAAKCSTNFFVYLFLKAGYRQRIYEILGCVSIDQRLERRFGTTGYAAGGIGLNVGKIAVIEPLPSHQKRDSIADLAKIMERKRAKMNKNKNFPAHQLNAAPNLMTDKRASSPMERQKNARKAWAMSRHINSN